MYLRQINEALEAIRNNRGSEVDAGRAGIDKNRFAFLLKLMAKGIMARRGEDRDFVIDDNNKAIIRKMYGYFHGDARCGWDPKKGIFLGGKIGCGKTVLLEAFCKILEMQTGYVIELIPAPQLYQYIRRYGMDGLKSRPLLIDELGREQLEMNDFGTIIRPVEDLMSLRYETGAKTFITSNFRIETLTQGYDQAGHKVGYGQYIGDRFRSMLNIDVLPGESRRI